MLQVLPHAQWIKSIKPWPKIKFFSCIFFSEFSSRIVLEQNERADIYVSALSLPRYQSTFSLEISGRVEKFYPFLKCFKTEEIISIKIRQNGITFWRYVVHMVICTAIAHFMYLIFKFRDIKNYSKSIF